MFWTYGLGRAFFLPLFGGNPTLGLWKSYGMASFTAYHGIHTLSLLAVTCSSRIMQVLSLRTKNDNYDNIVMQLLKKILPERVIVAIMRDGKLAEHEKYDNVGCPLF